MSSSDNQPRFQSVAALKDLFETRIKDCLRIQYKCITDKNGKIKVLHIDDTIEKDTKTSISKSTEALYKLEKDHLVTEKRIFFEKTVSDNNAQQCLFNPQKDESALNRNKILTNSISSTKDKSIHIRKNTESSNNSPKTSISSIKTNGHNSSNHRSQKQKPHVSKTPSCLNSKRANKKVEPVQKIRESIKIEVLNELHHLESEDEEVSIEEMNDDNAKELEDTVEQLRKSSRYSDSCVDSDGIDKYLHEHGMNIVELDNTESQIEACIDDIKQNCRDLNDFNKEMETVDGSSIRRSERIKRGSLDSYKSSPRSSLRYSTRSSTPKAKKFTKPDIESQRYSYKDKTDSDSDGVLDYFQGKYRDRSSFASNSTHESGYEEEFESYGGISSTRFVEAINPKFADSIHENHLYEITICREPIYVLYDPIDEVPFIETTDNSHTYENVDIFRNNNTKEEKGNQLEHDREEVLSNIQGEKSNPIYEIIHDNLNVNSATSDFAEQNDICENLEAESIPEPWPNHVDENLTNSSKLTLELDNENLLDLPKENDRGSRSPSSYKKFIIEELIDTEQRFIDNMEYLILNYMKYFMNHPSEKSIAASIRPIFGNIFDLCEETKKFLQILMACNSSVEQIANAFLQNKRLLNLHVAYMRNKAQTREIHDKFRPKLEERQHILRDKKICDSYLLSPVQRPGRYKLLLESLHKDLGKFNETCDTLDDAIKFVGANISEANTLLASDSIRGSPIDLTKMGNFIMKECFTIKKKIGRWVFLFEEIIVITVENKENLETYDFKRCIYTTNLQYKGGKNSTTFTLIDYHKHKIAGSTKLCYECEAETEAVYNRWHTEITNLLWKQANDLKRSESQRFRTLEKARQAALRNSGNDAVFYH